MKMRAADGYIDLHQYIHITQGPDEYAVYTITSRHPLYLEGLFVVRAGSASVGCVLSVNSSQKVQLDCVLRHPVLELVEKLTAAGQAEASLVQLNIRQTFRVKYSSPGCKTNVLITITRTLTTKCSTWFGHIHLPAGKAVSGGSRQSMWNKRGQ